MEGTPVGCSTKDSKVIEKYQDTDEDGNRRSILPSKARPKVPSVKKSQIPKIAKENISSKANIKAKKDIDYKAKPEEKKNESVLSKLKT